MTGASIQQLVSVNPSELLQQLQAASRRLPIWPFAVALLLIAAVAIGGAGWLLLLAGAPGVGWPPLRDGARRSVVVTNVAVPTLTAGSRSLHFLPDRVLVREGNTLADVAYQRLSAAAQPIRFIEQGAVPPDGRVVDTTWRFVNVNGGPDRRFKNNRRLPVLEYGRLTIFNQQRLRMIWGSSQVPQAIAVANTLRTAASAQIPSIRP